MTVLCASSPVFALDASLTPADYLRQRWGVEDGLPSDSVAALNQSASGHLLIGTLDGVARFDGARFVPLSDPRVSGAKGSGVRVVTQAFDGALWVGWDGDGLARLLGGTWSWLSRPHGPVHPYLRALVQSADGDLWACTVAGVSRLSRTGTLVPGLSPVPERHRVCRALALDARGRVWIASTRGAAVWDGTQWKDAGVPAPAHAVSMGPVGKVWIATDGGLAALADGQPPIWYTRDDGLPSERLSTLAHDRDGVLWIGTRDAGLVRYAGGVFAHVPLGEEPGPSYISALLEDREGGLWVGTRGAGLLRLRNPAIQLFTSRHGLPSDRVRAVHQAPDGTLWVGTAAGLARRRADRFEPVDVDVGAHDREIVSLVAQGERVVTFVTGDGAVATWSESTLSWVPVPGHAAAVSGGQDGSVWIVGDALWSLRQGRVSVVEPQHLPAAPTAVHAAGSGRVWVGGLGWISTLDTAAPPSWFERARRGRVTGMHEDDEGSLWAALTSRGLLRLTQTGFTALTTREGLPSDGVAAVLTDAGGRLWLATRGGIVALRPGELALPADSPRGPAIAVLGAEQGVRGIEPGAGHPAAWRTRDGRLWFATGNGLAAVTPTRGVGGGAPPEVSIEEVTFDGRPVDTRAAQVQPTGGVLDIRYPAPSFNAPARVRFRYRLHGYDQAWVDGNPTRLARYTRLPPGTFRFQVIADDGAGVWNERGVSFSLYVPAPVYRRWWFLLACGAVSLALLVAGQRAWLAVLRSRDQAVSRERLRVARDVHDSLAQGFCALSWQLQSLEDVLDPAQPVARDRLERANATVRSSLNEAREAITRLRPAALGRSTLPEALQALARRSAPDGRVQVTTSGPARALIPRVEDNLLRIAQEAVTNALRHAGARRVDVRLAYAVASVSLVVEDDGRGFDPAAVVHGFGLLGMRERAADLSTKLQVDSRPGAGTRLGVEVPT